MARFQWTWQGDRRRTGAAAPDAPRVAPGHLAGAVALTLALTSLVGTAQAGFTCNTLVARKGDSAAGEGTFRRFAGLAINDAGLVAISADQVKSGGQGIFVRSAVAGMGAVAVLARRGQPAPGGGFFAKPFSTPSINAAGTIAFAARLSAGPGAGIFKGVPGALAAVVRQGDPAPTCGGQFASFGAPSLDGDGDVVFSATLAGSPSPAGIFVVRVDASMLAITCAEIDTTLADGATVEFDEFGTAVQNDAGSVAFIASAAADLEPYTDGVYRFDESTGEIVQLARLGAPVPDVPGATFYRLFDPPAIDPSGVTFHAWITGDVYQGIFRVPPDAPAASLALRGDPVPGGGGVRFKRFAAPATTATGTIAFRADNLAGNPRHEVVVVPDGAVPETVALAGEAAPVPDAGTVFTDFKSPVLNGNGFVVFAATLSGSGAANAGVFACQRL